MTTMPSADRDFQRFAIEGDLAAFTRVYEATAGKLLAMAVRLVRDAGEAEELVQATFVAAIDSAASYDPARPVEGWLAGILSNRARRLHRRTQPQALDGLHDRQRGPALAVEDKELQEAIHERIDSLSEPYRSVAILHLRNGLAPSEVAYALGRSPATVRSQLQRAKQMLRSALPVGVAVTALAVPATAGLAAVQKAVTAHAAVYAASLQTTLAATATSALSSLTKTAWIAMTGSKIAMTGLGLAAVLSALLWWNSDPERPDLVTDTDGGGTELASDSDPMDTERDGPKVGEASRLEAGEPLESLPPMAVEAVLLGELEVEIVHDGLGVPSVVVELSKPGDPWSRVYRGATDANGVVVLEDIPEGTWWMQTTSDAEPRYVEIRGRERVQLSLETSAPHWIQGVVVDEAAQPVAGASVWTLPQPTHGLSPFLRTETDEVGSFRLPLWELAVVGASADGHWPAQRLVKLDEASVDGDSQRIRLTLRQGAASWQGRVLDAATHRPVRDAIVVIHEDPAEGAVSWPDGSAVSLDRTTQRVGAGGAFAFAGLVPGQVRVTVESLRHARTSFDIELSASSTTQRDLHLGPGARVFGRILGADGTPAVGVTVGEEEAATRHPRSAETDEQGRYELVGLPVGPCQLKAYSTRGVDVREVLELSSGAAVEWSPRLQEGTDRISGTLTDARGQTLEGWFVVAREGRFDVGSSALVASDGSFELGRFIDRGKRTLRAHPPERERTRGVPKTAAVQSWPGIEVGASGLDLVVADANLPTAWLRGRVDREAISRRVGAIFVTRDDGSRRTMLIQEDGSFEMGPLAPGLVRLSLPGQPQRKLGQVELVAGQNHDLGLLSPEELGTASLRVDLDRPWAELRGKIRFALTDLETGEQSFRPIWQNPLELKLPVGRHRIQLIDAPFEPLVEEFEVRAGDVTELVWSPKRCPLTSVWFEPRSPFTEQSRLAVTVFRAGSGDEILLRSLAPYQNAWRCDLNLPVGQYVVRASDDGGAGAEFTLEVSGEALSRPRGRRVRLK